jgi:hypothetical protein
MILPDSTQLVNDTSAFSPMDSLARIDSLLMVDSIRIADSIKAIIPLPTGYIGISHPSLPHTESWVFAILICLFLLMVYSFSHSAGLLIDTAKTFFQVKERSSIFSKSTINDLRFRFFIIVFSIGAISFYLYLTINQNGTQFTLLKFSYFYLATALFFLLKSLLLDLIGYVFLDHASLKIAKESYFNILSFVGIVLFPILLLRIYISPDLIQYVDTIALVVSIIAFILVVIKLFQIFLHKIVASFYIMLYLCTLEFLPLIALYQVYRLII